VEGRGRLELEAWPLVRSAVVFSGTGVQAGMRGTWKPLSLARCKYCIVTLF